MGKEALLKWLDERIAWYTKWCMNDAAKRGYPGKIRYASQDMRYALEAYQEVRYQMEFLGLVEAETDHEAVHETEVDELTQLRAIVSECVSMTDLMRYGMTVDEARAVFARCESEAENGKSNH
jgi:hypothetical protein